MRSPAVPRSALDNDSLKIAIAIAAALFAGLALSPKLWLTERVYPTTPVLPFLRSIPAPLDYILYGAMLAMLVAIAIVARPAKLIWIIHRACDRGRVVRSVAVAAVVLSIPDHADRGGTRRAIRDGTPAVW